MSTNRFLGSGNNVNDYAREQTLENIEDQLINGVTQVSVSGGISNDINITEIKGNPINTGFGNSDLGTIRTVLATNQPDVGVDSNSANIATVATLSTIKTDTAPRTI